jgi:hypothetical protein
VKIIWDPDTMLLGLPIYAHGSRLAVAALQETKYIVWTIVRTALVFVPTLVDTTPVGP